MAHGYNGGRDLRKPITDAELAPHLAMFKSTDPTERLRAVNHLGPLMSRANGVYEALLPLVTMDPDDRVRSAAFFYVE